MGRKKKQDTLIVMPSAVEVVNEVVKEPQQETTLERIYRENGVTAEMVHKQPRLSASLASMPGGWEVAVEYMRGSDETEVSKFLDIYDRLSRDEKEFLEYEGICAAAGVSGKKLFGIIVAEAMATSEQQVAFISAIKTPDVIDATLEIAKQPGGHRERKLVAQASGWLPRPKGAQTNIQINTANMGNRQGNVIDLPPFDQDIRELGEKFQTLNSDSSPKLLEGK